MEEVAADSNGFVQSTAVDTEGKRKAVSRASTSALEIDDAADGPTFFFLGSPTTVVVDE